MNSFNMYSMEVEAQGNAEHSGVDLGSHGECSGKELENETSKNQDIMTQVTLNPTTEQCGEQHNRLGQAPDACRYPYVQINVIQLVI